MLGDDAPTPEQESLKKRVHCKTHGKFLENTTTCYSLCTHYMSKLIKHCHLPICNDHRQDWFCGDG